MDAETIRSFSGLRVEKVFEQYFNYIPAGQHQDLLKLYKVNERKFMSSFGGRLFPGVKEELSKLSQCFRLFIVSNCLSGYIENFMEFHGLQELFTDFESSGNTGLPKSENIKDIVARNGLQRPVYIGDTIWDQEAAQEAGVPFIYARYGFGKVENPDCQIDALSDLHEIMSPSADSLKKTAG